MSAGVCSLVFSVSLYVSRKFARRFFSLACNNLLSADIQRKLEYLCANDAECVSKSSIWSVSGVSLRRSEQNNARMFV